MDTNSVLKLVAFGLLVAIVLQVTFYFVFQVIGYDSYLLSFTLLGSLFVFIALLAGWKILKGAAINSKR